MTSDMTSSTTYYTPESVADPPNGPSHTPTAPSRTRATSDDSYFNVSWSSALAGLPPALPISMSKSNVTRQPFILSTPPSGLLYKRRLWNLETDHGRLCDPDGWQGSMENQQRLDEQRQINEEWLEERGLEPLDASVFKKIEWKKGATRFEVVVSPRTIVVGNGVVESPWTQAAEAHGSLSNSRRHHARTQANREWLKSRGESPVSVDTFTAMEWYVGSGRQDQVVATSPRGTALDLTESRSIRYGRSTSTSSIGRTQSSYPSISSTTDSLSSFADLINKYNAELDNIGKFSISSIGRTQYPYPSPIPSPSLTHETDSASRSGSVAYDSDDNEPVLQTASLALGISPRSSKVSMLSAGHASQARRSPRTSETLMPEAERLLETHATQAGRRGPLSPKVRLVVVRGRAVREGSNDVSGWSRDLLMRTPTDSDHKHRGIWAKTKGMLEKLNCRDRK